MFCDGRGAMYSCLKGSLGGMVGLVLGSLFHAAWGGEVGVEWNMKLSPMGVGYC